MVTCSAMASALGTSVRLVTNMKPLGQAIRANFFRYPMLTIRGPWKKSK